MKKTIILLITIFALVTTLSGCGESSQTTGEVIQESNSETSTEADTSNPENHNQGEYTIKFAVVGNEDHQSTVMAKMFKEEVEQLSEKRIMVEIYPNASLGGEREVAESVKLGSIQMSSLSPDGVLSGWIPNTQILSIPYLFENKEQAYKALDGVIADRFKKEFDEQGFKFLGLGELGFRHFTNNVREVKTASDMNGLDIRVQEAPIWFALGKSLGFSPVPVAFNELYTALQQGMVDGQENPVASIYTMKFNEVQKYLTLDGHTYATVCMVMNKGYYDSLPKDMQDVVDQAALNAVPRQRKAIDDKETQYLQELEDAGMIVTEPDKASFKEATKQLYKDPEVEKLVEPDFIKEVMGKIE